MKRKILYVLCVFTPFILNSCNSKSEKTHVDGSNIESSSKETESSSTIEQLVKYQVKNDIYGPYKYTEGDDSNVPNVSNGYAEFDCINFEGFAGWELSNVENNVKTYKAKFKNIFSWEEKKSKLYLGTYPQTQLDSKTDVTLIKELNSQSKSKTWSNYNYYMYGIESSFMQYIDIDFDSDGEYDYRGVKLSSYRFWSSEVKQYYLSGCVNTDFELDTIYWYKYEPLLWDLVYSRGQGMLLISDLIIDSQDFNHTSNSGKADYESSSIRSWLNSSFYNTAFSDFLKKYAVMSATDEGISPYIGSDISSNDYVFLDNSKNGKSSVTDYAKIQGISYNETGLGTYWLKSGYVVNENNDITNTGYSVVESTYTGVRPSIWINVDKK